jgi:hypothetical protein
MGHSSLLAHSGINAGMQELFRSHSIVNELDIAGLKKAYDKD